MAAQIMSNVILNSEETFMTSRSIWRIATIRTVSGHNFQKAFTKRSLRKE